MFLSFLLSLLSLSPTHAAPIWDEELDEFLGEGHSEDIDLIDPYEAPGGDFELIDTISKQKEKVIEKIEWKEPPDLPARIFTETKPFTAQLKKGAVLIDIKTKKQVRIYRPVIVKARETSVGSQISYILDKEGNKRYTTRTSNAINIEQEIQLESTVNPLIVYTDQPNYHTIDKDLKFETFISMQMASQSTDYYASIYRGEKKSANETSFMMKTLMDIDSLPINFGLAAKYDMGYWEDEISGTVTWNAISIGPAFQYTFWEKKEGRWNLHLSVLKSLYHRSDKTPKRHEFSTIGSQIEVEKEFYGDYGKWALGLKYSFMQSSVKETDEYLENTPERGVINSIGAYLSYHFDWRI